ncbi:phosphatidate cytidylyltransferase [Paracoccus aerodenitrificans]|uniref:phosphatidate cytidylyltransferase n=1 Tax=Paracoccus aerodenitrificans TaxID=3017781 RepID=UPI0022F00AE1|nr:phosphatidate cytidylyltransferase [Paracoccus aerodenitrificans]WBU62663.1 phosphatidate cytidylyltransferase [Paracoccus aerodenitrificans]
MAAGGKWSDLTRRVTSAVILIGIGVMLALSTGLMLWAGVALFMALTFWELARMTGWKGPARFETPLGRSRPIVLAVAAGLSLFAALGLPSVSALILLIPIIAGLPGAVPRDRLTYAVFGYAIMAVGFELVHLRQEYGLPFILWLMGVVIISDILGYFAGRMIGGPKFWPSLSPKKTWSGTVAGWVGALIFGLILWLSGLAGAALIFLSPVVAFAGQMGDMAESWLKRRAGVKDSSNLIPGHGGFMDRFDAVSGAVLAIMMLSWVMGLPQVGF